MTTLGKYELHEQLGKGGFGTVYRATDTSLGREVALKILHPQLMVDEEFITRFKREARTLAALDNHHIVTVYEIGEEDGRIFIAMRYLQGGSLKQRLLQAGPIPWEQALRILVQVSDGLGEAHAKGMLHRDIKPENILFDAHGETVLTDFGLVKAASGTSLSSSGVLIGTPAYIAPEIWSGKPSTPAADVYALACVFYEMLTGKVLFEGDSTPEVMKKHFDPLVLPETWPAGVPAGINRLVEKALFKDSQKRCLQVSEFSTAAAKLEVQEIDPNSTALLYPAVNRQSQPFVLPPIVDEPPINQEPNKGSRKVLPFVLAGIALVILVIGASTHWFGMAVVPTPTEEVYSILGTPVSEPTVTQIPMEEPIPPTSTENFKVGDTQVSPKDGMVLVYVPGGTFTMGSEKGNNDEKPVHLVTLDAFWIDQTEVTNAMFKKCVDNGNCTSPSEGVFYNNIDFANHPVTFVNWTQAAQYCVWAGRQLPTEAQWEYAARGTDGRTFPWGNSAPTCEKANYTNNGAGCLGMIFWTAGYQTAGKSWVDAYDLAGNVWEWVADWYDENYYSSSTSWTNPTGPANGDYKVLRGGSSNTDEYFIRSSGRHRSDPNNAYSELGFRCLLPLQ